MNTITQANRKLERILNSNKVEHLTNLARINAIKEMVHIMNHDLRIDNFMEDLKTFKVSYFKDLMKRYNSDFDVKGKSYLELAKNADAFEIHELSKNSLNAIAQLSHQLFFSNRSIKGVEGDTINVVKFKMDLTRLDNATADDVEMIQAELYNVFIQHEEPDFLLSVFNEILFYFINMNLNKEYLTNASLKAA